MRTVVVVPHDPQWYEEFNVESKQVTDALGHNVVAIHHIGSTAIPGMYAKPIIDILVEVQEITAVDGHNASIESLGYEVMGEFGIPGRRFFRKDNQEGIRTHHIHSFAVGSDRVTRHLAFRDYMIAHFEDARAYSELKQRLAIEHPTNINGYMDGKDEFIKAIDRKAAQWRNNLANATPNYLRLDVLHLGVDKSYRRHNQKLYE
jgi:GrpB-like predicted nucleotidyltransferase (UPF0157 family)